MYYNLVKADDSIIQVFLKVKPCNGERILLESGSEVKLFKVNSVLHTTGEIYLGVIEEEINSELLATFVKEKSQL